MQSDWYIVIQLAPKKWAIARRSVGKPGWYRVVAVASTEWDASVLLNSLTTEKPHAAEA